MKSKEGRQVPSRISSTLRPSRPPRHVGAAMLVQLTIQNLVLIERLTLELSPGFNVITGETGAGKSMLVDALGLVIGGRASPELVRKGAREAEVEALFDVAPGSRVAARLEAAGIPCDRELVLRRVVQAEGRSRAFANGRMCTLSQLADLAGDLCDIASQHESVALTDPATHLDTLDAFGGLESARLELGAEVDELAALGKQLEALRAADRGRAEREDFLAFQLRELEELDVQPGGGDGARARAGAPPSRRQAVGGDPGRPTALRRRGGHLRRPGEARGGADGGGGHRPFARPLARAVEGARVELAGRGAGARAVRRDRREQPDAPVRGGRPPLPHLEALTEARPHDHRAGRPPRRPGRSSSRGLPRRSGASRSSRRRTTSASPRYPSTPARCRRCGAAPPTASPTPSARSWRGWRWGGRRSSWT